MKIQSFMYTFYKLISETKLLENFKTTKTKYLLSYYVCIKKKT